MTHLTGRATSGSRDTGPAPVSAVSDLFRQAVAALDHARGRRRTADAAGRAAMLQESARCLAAAFLSARGDEPSTHAARIKALSAHPAIDVGTDRPLIELLRIDPGADWTNERIRDLMRLEEQYRSLMPRFRAALARQLPEYGSLWRLITQALGRRRVLVAAAAVAAAVVGAGAAFALADPAYRFQVNGQVFWKHDPGAPFAESRSRHFDVSVDGDLHAYTITFDDPVRVGVLRIDPVDSASVTEVELLGVHYLDTAGNAQPAGDDFSHWSCRNCRWLAAQKHGARIKPDNDDPYLIAPAVAPREASAIRIEMRARAGKSFWEWVTRLDKRP